ncbi:MAG TPA: M23 family metallopeptidase [Gammaproteobacteria bacterium]|nr:M23 family metallopeptidase [Gammaproteobacteria bacterium]
MRFPLEKAPAYINSQQWGVGGIYGPRGSQCDIRNYSYPWRDNFCETRSWDVQLCPTGKGHQGVDIRGATCTKSSYGVVAVENGAIFRIGTYSVWHRGDSGMVHRYLHMDSVKVKIGDIVRKGQLLGMVSNVMDGVPTTVHLHYDMKHSDHLYVPPYMSLVKAYQTLLEGEGRPDWWDLWSWFFEWGWSGR